MRSDGIIAGFFSGVALIAACGGHSGSSGGGQGQTAGGAGSTGGATTGGSTTGGTTTGGTTTGGGADGLCHPAGGAQYCLSAIADKSGAALPPGVPVAMNDAGTLAFNHETYTDGATGSPLADAWLWHAGVVTLLPHNFAPTGINHSDALSGWVLDGTGNVQAGLWSGGQLHMLKPPTAYHTADAIDDSGRVVGNGPTLWSSADADPQLVGSPGPCEGMSVASLNPQQLIGGELTYQKPACSAPRNTNYAAVTWNAAGERTLVQDQIYGGCPLSVASITDDGSRMLVLDSCNAANHHVIGIDYGAPAYALGPAGHIYFGDGNIRWPDGSLHLVTGAGVVDAPAGWDLSTLDIASRAPPEISLNRPVLGFDRHGRMYAVANFNGTPAPLVLTPEGQALP